MEWELRAKEIAYYGGSLKNLIFSKKKKKSNIQGGLSKNGVLGQYSDLKEYLAKKLGGIFERV